METGEDGEKHFRQLLILTEACYSASVMHICEGIEGVLAFTVANGSNFGNLYTLGPKELIEYEKD